MLILSLKPARYSAAIIALTFLPVTALAAGGDEYDPRGSKWGPLLNQCYRGNAVYDEACVQQEILKRGMMDQFGKACFLREHRSGRGITDAPRIKENLRFFKREGCAEFRVSYDEALRQCAAAGLRSCRAIAGAGGAAPATTTTTQPSGGILGGILGGGSDSNGSPGVGTVLDGVDQAADTFKKLKGLFD